MMDAVMLLDNIVDESDPDVSKSHMNVHVLDSISFIILGFPAKFHPCFPNSGAY